MVKVRFAPSPTGYLHVGGARTALFNWMYAKAQGGVFVLRIEDTDKQRSKQEFVDEILDSLKWLGFNWDEIYFQSQRFDIYLKYAQKLFEEGKAYKDGGAVVLKMSANPALSGLGEPGKIIRWEDLIRGEIVFDTGTIKDQVLIKSDGSPTYSFACVVDDALMEISCVIRGEDHISNTPKQIAIYQALGFKIPKFAHLPLILDDERARLSKRAGAVAVTDYRRQGFLSEAIVNYLMLLGWSPGDNQEMVKLESAVKKFSIKKINKAGAAFSMDKLKWLNGQYIKQMPEEKLTEALIPFLKEKKIIDDRFDPEKLRAIVKAFQPRLLTLLDFLDWTDFIFKDQFPIDEEAKNQYLTEDRKKEFHLLRERFSAIEEFNAENVEKEFRGLTAELGIKSSDLVHPVRVALTGKSIGPGLFETIALLGKERTLKRLADGVCLAPSEEKL